MVIYEDFTTYTEVDVAADRIQKTANHTDHKSYRNETTYLYKDYGAAHFGDFTHKIKVKSDITDKGHGAVWCLSNVVKNLNPMKADGDTHLFLVFYLEGATKVLYLREVYNSINYTDTYNCSENTWYYIKIVKSGTSLTAYIYSDSDYSTLLDTLTLTLHGDHTFRYLYACNTYNDGQSFYSQQDIENFDIGNRICAETGSGVDIKSSLSIVTPSETILDPMDATTGWAAQGGMTSITVNTTTKKEGTAALNLIKGANDDTDAYIEKTISSTNLTSKYVKVWLYLKDTATVNKISQAQIYLYDTSNNYRGWDITNLSTGWNLIIADTETAPDHQSGTPGNLAAITKLELDVDTNQATDTYAEGDVIADYYHYSGFDISDSGSGAEAGIVSKQFIEADTGSGVDALGARSFCAEDTGIGEEAFPLVGLSDGDTGSGTDIKEDLLKVTDKTGSDTGSGVDISSSKDFIVPDNGSAIEASSFSYRDCISADNGSAIEALGSREFTLEDTCTGIDAGERRFPPAESRGFYYAKIGSTIFRSLSNDSFRITEELNKIPSFEFEIANTTENRAAIAAGLTDILRIYNRLDSTDTLMFTGIINSDAIEYLSLERIRLVGYASYIDLNWRFHKHLNSEDAENVDNVFDYSGSYTDYTTAANNDTINDVLPTFDSVNDVLYIGQSEQFFGAQIKYSTKGVQAGSTTVVFEYSKGNSVWSTLDVLDETRQFTQDAGTYYVTIPHKPSDWAKETVNSAKKFWIRVHITAGSYTTAPKLDRIKITNVDVFRVYYFQTAANSIMDDLLAGTGYTMDVTDTCPTTEISIVAEYETKLRFIAGVTNALTWDDSGDKKAYQWWIDTSKKVHLKQKRGNTLGDMSSKLTVLNNVQDYFNLSNCLHYLGNYDGLNQLKAVIEDISSQDTHGIRELAVPEERYNNYIPLKEAAQKAMTYTKAPLQKIAATMPTRNWLNEALEVGDTVTLHQDKWNVSEQAFQIVRADIGPRDVNFDLGVSQEHLDSLKAGLQRQMDISGIRMHGSTLILQFGPNEMNYQRVDDTTVYPSRLKFEIPSDARYIHKIVISWKMGNYRADVTGGEESEGHDHTGFGGAGGAHEHGGFAGAGGAHDSSVLDGGLHTPIALAAGAHDHDTNIADVNIVLTLREGYLPDSKYVSYESSHTHTNPDTGYKGGHIHSVGDTGGPDDTAIAVTNLVGGTACASGWCVQYQEEDTFALDTHCHSNPNTGVGGGHDHTIGNTGSGTSHQHTISTHAVALNYVRDIHIGIVTSDTEPAHDTTINEVSDHHHTAVAIAAHVNHVIANQIAHGDHSIVTQAAAAIDIVLGIVEIAGGTTMMLIVNGETVASDYNGDQTDVVITGYTNTGSNTVEIQPIIGANTKGSISAEGRGKIFIETSSF